MRYVIGDIHGGSCTFNALLDQLNIQPDDRIYLLGDYIDRGPDSKGVLDSIMRLMEDGYDVRPILGNHDDMLLSTLKGATGGLADAWLSQDEWGGVTLISFGVGAVQAIPRKYVDLLAAMPCVELDDDFVFVHAGLNMDLPDPIAGTSSNCMLWGDSQRVDISRLGGRRLVTGHAIATLAQIRASLQGSRIYLDNGAYKNSPPEYGNLLALNLDSIELTCQPWLDDYAEMLQYSMC